MGLRIPRLRAVWPPRPSTRSLLRRVARDVGKQLGREFGGTSAGPTGTVGGAGRPSGDLEIGFPPERERPPSR